MTSDKKVSQLWHSAKYRTIHTTKQIVDSNRLRNAFSMNFHSFNWFHAFRPQLRYFGSPRRNLESTWPHRTALRFEINESVRYGEKGRALHTEDNSVGINWRPIYFRCFQLHPVSIVTLPRGQNRVSVGLNAQHH
jgi:hypothetical protein